MITQKEVRELFKYNKETGILRWRESGKGRKKSAIAGNVNSKGYVVVCVKGKEYKAHRLIWLGMTGSFPENQIDHDDRVKHNNKWNNLVDSTQSQNMHNTPNRKDNTSGVKGVHWNKHANKWISIIKNNCKKFNLGSYEDFDDAVCARLAGEQCLGLPILKSSAYMHVKNM